MMIQFAYADQSELNSFIETNEEPTQHLPDDFGGQLSNFVSEHQIISGDHEDASRQQTNPTLQTQIMIQNDNMKKRNTEFQSYEKDDVQRDVTNHSFNNLMIQDIIQNSQNASNRKELFAEIPKTSPAQDPDMISNSNLSEFRKKNAPTITLRNAKDKTLNAQNSESNSVESPT